MKTQSQFILPIPSFLSSSSSYYSLLSYHLPSSYHSPSSYCISVFHLPPVHTPGVVYTQIYHCIPESPESSYHTPVFYLLPVPIIYTFNRTTEKEEKEKEKRNIHCIPQIILFFPHLSSFYHLQNRSPLSIRVPHS